MAVLFAALPAGAQPKSADKDKEEAQGPVCRPVAEASDEQRLACARKRFDDGITLAGETRWAEALGAFREAAANRDAAVVQLNIAYCLRALGHYVAARLAVRQALAQRDKLSADQLNQAEGYEKEFDGLIARLKVSLEPADAALSVGGRPLISVADEPGILHAGVAPPAEPSQVNAKKFTVLLDPGHHLFRASRPGRADVLVAKTVRPGQQAKLDLRLDALPATVSITTTPKQAIVRAGGREVGVAPVEFERPAGKLKLEVVQDGFEPHEADLDLTAGQRADLNITLRPEEERIYEQWWFWTVIGVGVTGAIIGTYFGVTANDEPPAYDGGSIGWVASPLVRF